MSVVSNLFQTCMNLCGVTGRIRPLSLSLSCFSSTYQCKQHHVSSHQSADGGGIKLLVGVRGIGSPHVGSYDGIKSLLSCQVSLCQRNLTVGELLKTDGLASWWVGYHYFCKPILNSCGSFNLWNISTKNFLSIVIISLFNLEEVSQELMELQKIRTIKYQVTLLLTVWPGS